MPSEHPRQESEKRPHAEENHRQSPVRRFLNANQPLHAATPNKMNHGEHCGDARRRDNDAQ